ncbi:unnamed protein product [Amoebophrya sp. A120]|nr:unnamed protein product [Amoebophrya sp. A120]|eukprot:GSA120T00013255001.1
MASLRFALRPEAIASRSAAAAFGSVRLGGPALVAQQGRQPYVVTRARVLVTADVAPYYGNSSRPISTSLSGHGSSSSFFLPRRINENHCAPGSTTFLQRHLPNRRTFFTRTCPRMLEAQMGTKTKAVDLRAGMIYQEGNDPDLRLCVRWEPYKKGRYQVHYKVDYKKITGADRAGGYSKYFCEDVVRVVKLSKTGYYFSYADRENGCIVVTTDDFEEVQLPMKHVGKMVLQFLEEAVKPDDKIIVHRDEQGGFVKIEWPKSYGAWLRERGN